jgi:4-hydroxy-2-oxoheptanedioate aldolase
MSADSPYLAEVLSHCGYDAVTVDLQHGMFDVGRAIQLLQAVSAGPAVPLARCSALDAGQIGKLLDGGAYGIICPGVDTAEQAAAFVRACRYPPRGARSYGPSRGLLYGGSDYVVHADDTVLTWAMIESKDGLANLEAILATPGLDGVFVGPNDLALSLGKTPGMVPLPEEVTAAMTEIANAARAAGRWAGAFAPDAHLARRLIETGYQFVAPGNDVSVLRQAAAERIAIARGKSGSAAKNSAVRDLPGSTGY